MEWLSHDEVDRGELPAWAQQKGESLDGRPYQVVVHAEGMVLLRGRTASVLRWEDILVPIRLDEPRRLLVATARRAPRPPWFELGGIDVARVERIVRERLDAVDHGGYRERKRRSDPMPPDVVLTKVLERAPLPGAVEIPAATPSAWRRAALGASIGGAVLGGYGLILGPAGAAAGAGLGASLGAALMAGIETLRKHTALRVLVLTPDAFVGGLDGQSVRAVPWFRVGRFAEGVDESGESALEVFGAQNELIERVAARYFGKPLDVIVAVAEAYRRRASEALE